MTPDHPLHARKALDRAAVNALPALLDEAETNAREIERLRAAVEIWKAVYWSPIKDGPMTNDIPALAAKLSVAQRNAIFWLTDDWTDDRFGDALVSVLWSVDACLCRPAIIEWKVTYPEGWRPVNHHRLTPLGIALRQHIMGQKDERAQRND